MGQNEILQKAEDVADQILRHSKHVLPHLARFCLVSTFFEDGIRMYFQWSEQKEYIDHQWGCGWFVATLFVIVNLVGQLAGCFMILARQKVEIAVGILFGIIVLQVNAKGPVHSQICQLVDLTIVFCCVNLMCKRKILKQVAAS